MNPTPLLARSSRSLPLAPWLALVAAFAAAGCSDTPSAADAAPAPSVTPGGDASAPPGDASAPRDAGPTPDAGATPGNDETPPTGDSAAILKWLDAKTYAKWACEPAPHAARAGSAHSKNRVCSNGLASKHGAGEYPVGAASVKELFDANDKPSGHAYSLKTAAGGAEAWYFFEVLGTSVVANGQATSGSPKTLCAACHEGAGQGGQTGHDFVFTQVK
jgi:hypothetical protein